MKRHSQSFLLLALLTLALATAIPAHSENSGLETVSPLGGLTITVDAASRRYTLSDSVRRWTFTGSVEAPLSISAPDSGSDSIGKYDQLSFNWSQDGHAYIGTIRTYAGKYEALFSLESPQELTGPTPDFPDFTAFPSGLHTMSYRDVVFSPHSFDLQQTSTPWVFFDDHFNTAVLSPASDFIVAQMSGSLDTSLASGINSNITALPAGFKHLTALVIGSGIESTIHEWGNALTALSDKPKPNDDSDLMLKYLGYWTDNGATYYYNYDLDKGYTGTLLAVRDEYKSENIPLRYFQLDSWWYQKTRTGPNGAAGGPKNPKLPEGSWNAYGGTLDYSASPALFPNGLAAFDHDLGVPIAVHGRWIDPISPYHSQYKISGIAPVDPRYWDDRAKYLAQNGVFCYEQDWLVDLYKYSPDMATNLDIGNAFTDNMANAAKANGETLQYCMATPRFFLQGSKYDNLTTIRTSEDKFIRPRWNDFLYTSILADALHIRPWTDVLNSEDTGCLVASTLSAGPVGIGDKIGEELVPNIWKVIRGDGVIVKPDAPLLPTDSSILNDFKGTRLPLVASTFTNNGVKTIYVFALTRTGDSSDVSFSPASFGCTGKVYVSSLNGASKEINASDKFKDNIQATSWNSYIIAPVGKSGIAFLGDAGKFVGTGRQRIKSIADLPRELDATVLMASGESNIVLTGFASAVPTVIVDGKTLYSSYDAQTRQFSVTLTNPAAAGTDGIATLKVIIRKKAG